MKALVTAAICAFGAAFGLAVSASAAGTYTWTATGDGIGSATYVKIADDVGALNGRLRLVGFSTAEGEYTVTSNRLHEVSSTGGKANGLPLEAYTYQMSAGARFDGTTTKSLRVQLAQPANSYALYARITAVTTVSGDHMDSPDLREDFKSNSSTEAADLLANAVTKIVVGEIGDGTDIYTWTTGATPASLGYGAVRLTYNAEGGIASMTANPLAGRKIVIEGDEMEFAGDAKIYMAAIGELVFSNAVSAAANINVYNSSADDNTITYTGASNAANLNVSGYRVLFQNRNLDDWVPLSTGSDYGWLTGDVSPVYNIRRETDGTVTAQRQKESGSLVCVVKFQLRQNGSDIEGRVCYAGYWSKSKAPIGSDADAIMADMTKYDAHSQTVAISGSSGGYGISKMTLSRVGGLPTVRFAGGLDIYQILAVRQYAHGVYERAATGAVNMGYTVAANGVLTFRDPQPQFDPSLNAAKTGASSLGIRGSGVIEFEATDAHYGDEVYDIVKSSYAGWIPTTWVTVAENRQLSNLVTASARFGGYSMAGGWRGTLGEIQQFSSYEEGQERTGQFHYLFGGWLAPPTTNRCAALMVAFRQNGSNVEMCVKEARCNGGNGTAASAMLALYGTDLSSSGTSYTVATSNSEANYGIYDISLQFKLAYSVKEITVTTYPGFRQMVGSSTVPGGKTQLVIKGTDSSILRYSTSPLAAVALGALPATNGILRVQSGGDVVLNKTNASQSTLLSEDMAMISIEGGSLSQHNAWGLGWKQRVDIVGGEYRTYDLATLVNGQSILNYATFSGGTKLYSARAPSSDYIRAGYNQNAVWTVRGESASSCDANLSIWAYSTGNTMTFAVNDTGAAGSDFVMNGYISVNTQYPNTTVYKTGLGTMQLNAAVNLQGRPLILKDGTWLVNGSNLTRTTDPYTLDGGTLAVADATSNSLGVLTVGENGGGITLGAGATLTFADSCAAEWTGALTDRVIVTGFAEKSIRFGTTRESLTTAQRLRLRTSDNQRLYLDAGGYLTTTGPGTVLSFR